MFALQNDPMDKAVLGYLCISIMGFIMRTDHFELRLMNGPHRCAGRVEIFHDNSWGTVCEDAWDIQDAAVVCKQMDCGPAISALKGAYYGKGNDQIWLDNVKCNGSEALLANCKHNSWGEHDCEHDNDASVVCSMLRLADGPHRCAGRVELNHGNEWGTVCDEDWDLMTAAQLVCRQLGCGPAISAPSGAHFGPGSGRIWLSNVHCKGTETLLTECSSKHWIEHSCNHGQDAGVICSVVRVTGGTNHCNGRVEVSQGNQWGTVCSPKWGLPEAQVVCNMLGCGVALSVPQRSWSAIKYVSPRLADVSCNGTESVLADCQSKTISNYYCPRWITAHVTCSGILLKPTLSLSPSYDALTRENELELTCTIPDFDINVTVYFYKVNELQPLAVQKLRRSENQAVHRVTGLPALDPVRYTCQYELKLVGPAQTSAHSAAAQFVGLRLMDGPNKCVGRMEIYQNQQWGSMCDTSWTLQDSQVVCRALGCGMALEALEGAPFGHGTGPVWLTDITCKGTESLFTDCHTSSGNTETPTCKAVASVVCSGSLEKPSVSLSPTYMAFKKNENLEVRCSLPNLHMNTFVYFSAKNSYTVQKLPAGKSTAVLTIQNLQPWHEGEYSCRYEVHSSEHVLKSPGSEMVHVFVDHLKWELKDSHDQCSGRLEVFLDGKWGTVCARGWDYQDANVLCRELDCGYPEFKERYPSQTQGTGPIWLHEVSCNGTESHLNECKAKPFGNNDCSHGDDVNVFCSEMRLLDGPSHCAGRLEMLTENHTWMSVCNENWDLQDVQVVCKYLGCGPALAAAGSSMFGNGSSPILLTDMNCTGTEVHLKQCPFVSLINSTRSCSNADSAGVICSGVRLVEGDHPCTGKVELFHDGQWDPVSSRGWDIWDAQVVCKETGCGFAISVQEGSVLGKRTSVLWLEDVNCNGTESHLTDCPGSWNKHVDRHGETAGVLCTGHLPKPTLTHYQHS
ncbi:scavenger receptor cysteine-rich type 1 protein M130-like [Rhinatrema bivittatum]|uniref:scavenger receptor cysteine-rich type 1 protein M130-like n=1 Tax=Rhinatrema bivittatum TaxID=194408 RepID=UPI00112638B8|nr:scavenger receptor cysteine-rich type 1 protein M130-like [Rhinatrema bivittatum]